MATEYASRGLIGVLTPQANTTVEPEYSILCEPGIACIAARLESTKHNMNDRLVDYFYSAEQALQRFANAPVTVAAFACTGSAYLAGIEAEQEFIKRIENKFGFPLMTATEAIAQTLEQLRAKNIAVVSPYNDELHQNAMQYWRHRGLNIMIEIRLAGSTASFHPIYSIGTDTILSAIKRQPDLTNADAIVLLGTGMPSLRTLLQTHSAELPVLSTNLCHMWACTNVIANNTLNEQSLTKWLSGAHWASALRMKLQK